MKITLGLSLLLVSLPLSAVADAGGHGSRWGVMVNEETKSCAQYWEGNSCYKVTVPAHWAPLLPVWNDKQNALVLSYKGQDCPLGVKTAQNCCETFGLKWDGAFKAPQERTALTLDPKSECFQLPDTKAR